MTPWYVTMGRQTKPIKGEHMGVFDVPQWLLSSFVRSCVAVGATAARPEIAAAGERLLERWAEPGRFHHNVKHLVDVLAKVDQLAEETHDPEYVRLAAWYHGAVFSSAPTNAYAQRGGEDEVASSELAAAELGALGVPPAAVQRIHDIITGIARHRDAIDVDTQALCDAELATLAVEPQRYASYRRDVRSEYAHLPLRDYLTARIAILTKLLARKQLFASPLGHQWEDPARENLSAELARLKVELARLPEGDDGGPTSASAPLYATAEMAAIRATEGAPTVTRESIRGITPSTPSTPETATGQTTAPGTGQRDPISVIRRYERTAGREEKKPDLPGRS